MDKSEVVHWVATIGSTTERGGRVSKVSSGAEFDGFKAALVGDTVTYDDGTEATILDGSGSGDDSGAVRTGICTALCRGFWSEPCVKLLCATAIQRLRGDALSPIHRPSSMAEGKLPLAVTKPPVERVKALSRYSVPATV
ncbi:hypothetical protein [Caballeronia ptereochthonis]|uniref:hypothetical protein n=1 Tax=Caballeronia ptereochthonis TaxID=1777144 RepID=UPI00135938C3|nr:hypothetical protein [Caballeronia ptereochthonis]